VIILRIAALLQRVFEMKSSGRDKPINALQETLKCGEASPLSKGGLRGVSHYT